MAEMTDEQLLELISRYEKAALGSPVAAGATISTQVSPNAQMTTLEIDRYNALNMYYARPMGNEVENRSQVVIPELRDTIEWIMPQIMRLFVASKQVCRFEPEGPMDVQQAALESAVVNHVFMKENNGFFILHDIFKDALLLRNGYSKIYFEMRKQSNVERYTGLTEDEVAKLVEPENEDDKIEVLEQREYSQPIPPEMIPPQPPPQPGQPPQSAAPTSVQLFDLKIRRATKRGHVCVDCIPPEEMLVSSKARETNLDKVSYSCHKTSMTRSDLISDGYDKTIVNAMTAGRPNWLDMDALARNEVTDQMSVEDPADKAMQDIEVREVTIRCDFDGDGVAELRQVLVGGNKILDNEEIEESPMASCTPIRMPHRHTGISYYDLLADLQVIKTTLFRQGLDNLYLANNTRIGVDWKNCNIDDLLTSRPGGAIRTNGNPASVLMPVEQPSNLVQQVIPALQYVDSLREMRTGVGRDTMGLDADALADVTKGGQLAAMAAAGLKIELVARLLAEGVKDIFTKIHGALIRHQDRELEFELSGKWVKVNPTDWRRRTRVSVNVGLGSGNREEARANIALMGSMQEKLAPFGLVGPQQAYETFKRGAEVLGFENPERFAMDPSSPQYQQHMQRLKSQPQPPAPPVQVAQIKAQSEQATQNAENQRAVMNAQKELITQQQQAASDHAHANRDIAHDAVQQSQDRQVAMAGYDSQQAMVILKGLAQIIASQLKQDPSADAGQIYARDYQEAEAGIR